MAENSAIGWTDHTHNHWIGCTQIGPGCDRCYAKWLVENRMGKSFAERRLTTEENRRKPLKWNRQAEREGRRFKVFTNSLADVLDNQVPDDWRTGPDGLFPLIEATPHLDWIVVTKRIGNWQKMRPDRWFPMPPANIWLIITVTDQHELERDWLKLSNISASVIGLSIEPQLGPVDPERVEIKNDVGATMAFLNIIQGQAAVFGGMQRCRPVDWIITGGESQQTPKEPARPYSIAWAHGLIQATRGTKTALFLKQLGTNCPDAPVLRDRKGADPFEWPIGLRVQEFPR